VVVGEGRRFRQRTPQLPLRVFIESGRVELPKVFLCLLSRLARKRLASAADEKRASAASFMSAATP
jgi:hypothetical protein